MLYSIIPPILIVLSLIGIIVLLMKKSAEVEHLPQDEAADEFEIDARPATKFFGKFKNIKWDDIKHWWLAILEKVTRRARMLFLKLESRSANLSNSIRKKRNGRSQKNATEISLQPESDIMKKLEAYDAGTEGKVASLKDEGVVVAEEKIVSRREKIRQALFVRNKVATEVVEKRLNLEEKEIKPIISERVVTPKSRTEIRDRLEELLIERIAVNPKDIEAYERLGEYYLEIKSLVDSKECFKQVLKLDPKNRNAKYRMRRLENLLSNSN